MKYSIPAVIFAGGKSSRMGRDKALLPFAGFNSLTEYQYNRLQPLFEHVYISSKEEKFDFKAPFISDNYAVFSPLAGIISIFEILGEDEIFILSVDAPFVDETVIQKLWEEKKKDFDTIIAQSPNGIQPLCGIYRRSLLPLAKEYLAENRHRLTQLLKEAKSQFICFADDTPFANLNHPHEYEAALKQN